jgi:hypothetical protein
MAEEMFKPYTNHLPSEVASQYDEDEVLVLDGSLQDVAAKGWHFLDFAKFLEDRVVFLTPESAVVAYSDSPSHHQYEIDMICLRGPSQKKKTLHISSVNPEGSASALSSLLALFVSSNKDEECNEVVFKCFATDPRKPFGGVDLSVLPAVLDRSTCKVSLSFQFMSISPSQCHNILACEVLNSVEFRQCTVDGLAQVLRECKPGKGPQKLKMSCTQQEFANFAEGVRDNKSLRELDLLLHFIFSDEDKKRLIFCLQATNLERLTLEYLDMDDDCWSGLCKALETHSNLKVINLAFTDKFADAARRLDPERRTRRTQAVLNLVQTCSTIKEIQWPEFQQDKEIVPAIKECLEQRMS